MAELKTGEDWAWFQITPNESARMYVVMRIQDPHNRQNAREAAAYLDANILEKACVAEEAKTTPKMWRASTPGKEAFAASGVAGLDTLVNKHTYYITFP